MKRGARTWSSRPSFVAQTAAMERGGVVAMLDPHRLSAQPHVDPDPQGQAEGACAQGIRSKGTTHDVSSVG